MAKKLDHQSILKDSKAGDIDGENEKIEVKRLASLRKRRRRCCGCFFFVAFLALAALTLVDLLNK
jgi:hypothetical protein